MEWSNDLVLEFLDYYAKEPVIWNPSHDLHKNRNEVYDAWKRIQERLGLNYSVSDMKKKKESLMASFRTCYNKVKQSSKNAGSDDVYKPTWFAYEKMASFLRGRDQLRDAITLEDTTPQTNTENAPEESETHDTVNDEVLIPKTLTIPTSNSPSFRPPLVKKPKMSEDDQLKHKMDLAYSILQANSQKTVATRDVCHLYGKLIATKLRKMDERTRDIAMNRIDNLLFQMKMNHYQHQYIEPMDFDHSTTPNPELSILTPSIHSNQGTPSPVSHSSSRASSSD